MKDRLQERWHRNDVSDEDTFEVLSHVANRLAGLTMYERLDGSVVVFTDNAGLIRHVVSILSDNEWMCFCAASFNRECSATSYMRVRRLRELGA